MACNPTACRSCGAVYKACQLTNGLCSSCVGKGIKRTLNALSKTYRMCKLSFCM
jgi:hypothetical protein